MSSGNIKLHARLYRAQAIDESMAMVAGETDGFDFSRSRVGDHYVVSIEGIENPVAAGHQLAEVADIALVLTVERDRR